MAKRASREEPYNPVGAVLAQEVIAHGQKKKKKPKLERSESHRQLEDSSEKSEPTKKVAVGGLRSKQEQSERGVEAPTKATMTEGTKPRVIPERLANNAPLRVLLPTEERDEFDALVASLAKTLGTRVKGSHVLRACVRNLLRVEEQMLRRAMKAGGMIRPANGDSLALAQFEDDLMDLIDGAFHDTPPRRRQRE